jgi:5-methylcytosine-specific restriction endonuclease McrA
MENKKTTECTEDGCLKQSWARGLCPTHYRRVWVSENRERNNKNQRIYLKSWRKDKEDRDKRTARGERFRKNNLEKFANKERIRRGKKRSNGGKYSQKDWLKLLNRFGNICAYCGIRKATTADHVIPLAKGGSNFIGNILPACTSCNSSKQDTLLFEWRTRNVNRKENRA